MAVHGCDNVLSTLTLWASSASQRWGWRVVKLLVSCGGKDVEGRGGGGGLLPHGMVEA